MSALLIDPATQFSVPTGHDAALPPERRGLTRDGVRLLVSRGDGTEHRVFRDLPSLLNAGDLVIVNTSATVPAALRARRGDATLGIHVSGWLDDTAWIVEVRRADNSGPDETARAADVLTIPGGVRLRLNGAYPRAAERSRLWLADVSPPSDAGAFLAAHGAPIAYRHAAPGLPLGDYQNVYAAEPGSAEMASAGRPFTTELLARLVASGVVVAPLTLHAGVSSAETHEPPAPERFDVPVATARLVNSTRAAGGRVLAVGTTVVRALETVAADDGRVRPGGGWTDLVLGPQRPARAVDSLLTGLHLPESSHLLLLEAVAGAARVTAAYHDAVSAGYRWHEFGDSMLFLA